jgi:hypothetical protein
MPQKPPSLDGWSLHLENGLDIYIHCARNEIDQIVSDFGGSFLILLENIHILSIEDFDYLVNIVKSIKIGLAEFLRTVKSEPTKWAFRQHLSEAFQALSPPEYIDDEFLACAETLRNRSRNRFSSSQIFLTSRTHTNRRVVCSAMIR